MKQKPREKPLRLKPSHRDNRRYLIIDERDNTTIEQAILDYLGILGFAKAAYKKVKHKTVTNKTIGSCVREELHHIKAALTLAGIKVEKVAATIKGLSR